MGALLTGTLLAFRALVRNLMRAGLTILGILIGVAAVVTVTALGSGARERVSGQIQALGSNIFMISGQNAGSGARAMSGSIYKLSEEDARAIQREAVSVKGIAPILRARAQVL